MQDVNPVTFCYARVVFGIEKVKKRELLNQLEGMEQLKNTCTIEQQSHNKIIQYSRTMSGLLSQLKIIPVADLRQRSWSE
ncbi:hypothetical protein NQ315_003990 [Exocentrus adspersus]|uniref:Uncharacterized protein n=1 Tax=Exocentrus adspersus TaxID=1586481 RepID=A0AAV8VBN6_9CUCU|nr:hypothetical protein NQ315_003990 [Exocentrus adspersus]